MPELSIRIRAEKAGRILPECNLELFQIPEAQNASSVPQDIIKTNRHRSCVTGAYPDGALEEWYDRLYVMS